jgi:hypothetical protein
MLIVCSIIPQYLIELLISSAGLMISIHLVHAKNLWEQTKISLIQLVHNYTELIISSLNCCSLSKKWCIHKCYRWKDMMSYNDCNNCVEMRISFDGCINEESKICKSILNYTNSRLFYKLPNSKVFSERVFIL